ncbi:MAG: hypothetical protein WAL20_14595, partial [Rhodomicrobium sp.]
MKLPANFYRPLAIGAPLPLRELPVRPERMKHFAIAPGALPRSAGFAPAPAAAVPYRAVAPRRCWAASALPLA